AKFPTERKTDAVRKRSKRRRSNPSSDCRTVHGGARVSRGRLNIRVESALCDNERLEVRENAISSARTKFAGWTILGIRQWRDRYPRGRRYWGRGSKQGQDHAKGTPRHQQIIHNRGRGGPCRCSRQSMAGDSRRPARRYELRRLGGRDRQMPPGGCRRGVATGVRYGVTTDHVTLHLRGHSQWGQKLALITPDEIATTTITAEEQLRGRLAQIKKASNTEALAMAHRRFRQAIYDLAKLNILEFDS